MLKIITSIENGRPLAALISGTNNNNEEINEIIPIYHRGTGFTLEKAENNKKHVADIITNNTVIFNDFKSCVGAFDLARDIDYDAYDTCIGNINSGNDLRSTTKKLLEVKNAMHHAEWMKLVAGAGVVYQNIEDRGYLHFGKLVHPTFSLDTYSGRTRSTGFTIHNKNGDHDISHIDLTRDTFVHFDWIAADIRFGGVMSDDLELNNVFDASDPYTYIVNTVGDIGREDVKLAFFKALYNMEYEDPIFGLYPDFAKWLGEQKEKVDNNEPVFNIVGRPYYINKEHDGKAAINATLQGSVAAAVQAAMIKINRLDDKILVTDIYDSIVCACSQSVVNDVIKEVGDIIYRPFDGILDKDIRLPFKVSVGFKWYSWREHKVVR